MGLSQDKRRGILSQKLLDPSYIPTGEDRQLLGLDDNSSKAFMEDPLERMRVGIEENAKYSRWLAAAPTSVNAEERRIRQEQADTYDAVAKSAPMDIASGRAQRAAFGLQYLKKTAGQVRDHPSPVSQPSSFLQEHGFGSVPADKNPYKNVVMGAGAVVAAGALAYGASKLAQTGAFKFLTVKGLTKSLLTPAASKKEMADNYMGYGPGFDYGDLLQIVLPESLEGWAGLPSGQKPRHRRIDYMNYSAALRAGRRVRGVVKLLRKMERSFPHRKAKEICRKKC